MERLTQVECNNYATTYDLCIHLTKAINDIDDLQDQIYIIAGVAGGLFLIVLIVLIVLLVKIIRGSSNENSTKHLAKRGFSTYTGPPVYGPSPTQYVTPATNFNASPSSPAPISQAPSPPSHPYDSTVPGVKVLPRNPGLPRIGLSNGHNNEAYY